MNWVIALIWDKCLYSVKIYENNGWSKILVDLINKVKDKKVFDIKVGKLAKINN